MAAFQACQPRVPDVVVPSDFENLDPQLKAYLPQYIEWAREAPADADRHATLGLVYEANQLWPEAEACFVNAYRLDPSEPRALYHQALVSFELADMKQGLDRLEQLVERFPNFAPGQQRLGIELLATGARSRAIAAFERVIALVPNQPMGYVGLADAKLRAQDPAGALALLEKAIGLDPDDGRTRFFLGTAYRRLGRTKEAQRELASAAAGEPLLHDDWSLQLPRHAKIPTRQMGRALAFLNQGQFQSAIAIFETMLRWHPDNVEIMNNLAIARIHGGQPEQAREILLRAEQVDTARWATQVNLADCHLALRELEPALNYAERAVELGPKVADTHRIRGRCLMELGRDAEAYGALNQALGFDPASPVTHYLLGLVCKRLDRLAEAKGHFQSVVELNPRQLQAYLELYEVCLALGDAQAAAEAAAGAQSLAPNDPRVSEALKRSAARHRG